MYHLYQFIEPILKELGENDHAVTLADHGAGKSYLGFILYDLYFKAQGKGSIYGIETRAPLVEASQKLAADLGFERMHFLNMSVAESTHADWQEYWSGLPLPSLTPVVYGGPNSSFSLFNFYLNFIFMKI